MSLYRDQGVVLRTIRLGEADRIVTFATEGHGKVRAVAKGVRKTKSRFGARLEPLSHVELMLHKGGGELMTVTGVELVRPHSAAREDPYRLAIGLIGAEAMLRLFSEEETNARAFEALTRFLDVLDELAPRPSRPAVDPLALGFQLKLLWLAGYLPHLAGCASCGEETGLVGFSAQAGGGVCAACEAGSIAISEDGFTGIRGLLELPLAGAGDARMTDRGRRDALRVIESSYEYHGGFRLRTLKTA